MQCKKIDRILNYFLTLSVKSPMHIKCILAFNNFKYELFRREHLLLRFAIKENDVFVLILWHVSSHEISFTLKSDFSQNKIILAKVK